MMDKPDELKAQAKTAFEKTADAARWFWSLVPPLHPAGTPFVAIFAVATLLLTMLWEDFLCIGVILTLWCAYFFRNPERQTPDDANLVVSPADGMVSMIETVTLPGEFDTDDVALYTRVSIFLNVFDVHIQRVPVGGAIKEVVYRPGKFLNASLDKASEENERSSVLMETAGGKKIAFVQIAGLIARRIINDLKADQAVMAGERYGLIRFGSRLDLYLPPGIAPLVCVGQRMVGGETVMANLSGEQIVRKGVAR
jgi:phosphatidylserine decarboxylase